MSRAERRRAAAWKVAEGLEALEGRALLATGAPLGFLRPGSLPAGLIGRLPASPPSGVRVDPAAVAAIVGALNGGPGSEFVSLIRSQVPSLASVVADFTGGRRTEFNTPGIAAKIPRWNDAYNGARYDHMTGTLAGAVLQGDTLQLGAVMRGPFDEATPAYVVFGIDRGAGAATGPAFAARPGITPDLLVTIRVGPYGKDNSGTIRDLTTGTSTPIDPSKIQVVGAVVRVFVETAQLPSRGWSPGQYRFAMWTRSQPDGGIETVGSFVPESSMVQVGTPRAGNPTPPRLVVPRPRPRR